MAEVCTPVLVRRRVCSDAKLIALSLPFIAAKIIWYTAARAPYVLIGRLGDAWALSTAEMAVFLAATELSMIAGAFVGFVGDLIGNELVATLSLVALSSMLLLSGVLPPSFAVLMVLRVGFAVSACLFNITAQVSVVSGRTDVEVMRITGVMEFAWSIAGFAGVPLAGLLFALGGWRLGWIAGGVGGLLLCPAVSAIAVARCAARRRDAAAALAAAAPASALVELSDASAAAVTVAIGATPAGGGEAEGEEAEETALSSAPAEVGVGADASGAAARPAAPSETGAAAGAGLDEKALDQEARVAADSAESGDAEGGALPKTKQIDAEGDDVQEAAGTVPLRRCAHCREALGALLGSPSFLVFCVSAMITAALHSLIFAFFGMWIDAFFNLSASAATATTVAIGSAELLGQLAAIFCVSDKVHALTTLLVDHAVIGLGLVVFCVLAPLNLWGGLAGLFMIFGPFENLIVTQIAFVNAAAPSQHAALFNGVYWQVHYVGRTIGALCGPLLWEATDTGPFFFVCYFSFFLLLISSFFSFVGSILFLAHAALSGNATAVAEDDAGGWAAGTTAEGRARPFGPIAAVTLIPLAASIALTLLAAASRVPLCCGRRGDADDSALGLLRAGRAAPPPAAGGARDGNGDGDGAVGSGEARAE